MMLRSRMLLRSGLPNNYIECEYIENTSTAYIDTNWKPNQDTRIKTKIDILTFNPWAGFFGCRGEGAIPAYALYFQKMDTFYGHFGPGTTDSFVSEYSAIGIHNIEFNKGIVKIDTNIHNIGNYIYQLPVNMYLFGANENNISMSHTNIRIYDFKIWDDKTLVRNYISVKEKNTGLYGLYDLIEGKFYTSPNGVKFSGA